MLLEWLKSMGLCLSLLFMLGLWINIALTAKCSNFLRNFNAHGCEECFSLRSSVVSFLTSMTNTLFWDAWVLCLVWFLVLVCRCLGFVVFFLNIPLRSRVQNRPGKNANCVCSRKKKQIGSQLCLEKEEIWISLSLPHSSLDSPLSISIDFDQHTVELLNCQNLIVLSDKPFRCCWDICQD